ncbi:MAG: NADH-ubiquinone oxidoreductase-F iron-sulfur binding region domain-containing protein [Flavobacteriales bacterium]|nr:NADH-ubiquinone oxidoreductase-F iron-sulfur binding region domain-containing protein [Flavobacteriales bacterium]
MPKNLSELSGRKGTERNLFEALGKAAENSGTLSKEQMKELSEEFLFGKGNIYGATSFYDFLREENKGKKVYVCNGSACLVAGTQDTVKKKLNSHFEESEVGEMCCLGRCHENKAFWYNGFNYSGNDIDQIENLISNPKVEIQANDKYEVGCSGSAILTANQIKAEEYVAHLKKWLVLSSDEVLTQIKESGLRGRGGAGFPSAFKLEACAKAVGDKKFIVCNADEGDPGAYSDRYILEHQPYKLIIGMIMAGYVAGANTGVIYIRGEYPESVLITEVAIAELTHVGCIGENILNTGFSFHFKVIKAQGAYICGEETALLNSIEGQRPEVRVRPPYPAQQGLFNRPTVVSNVETLACIPFILENGGAHFASIGRGRSTGTKLVSLDGFFNRPGIYEVDMGTPLSQVVEDLGQGFRSPVKALHIGGPLGGLLPVSKIKELSIDFESFNEGGFLLGHASVVSIPADFPIISYLEHLFAFTAHESCGKCFPCRIGSTRGKEMIQKAQKDEYVIDRKLFNDLLETMEIGSLCALGGGVPLPIKNALRYFDEELKQYFSAN